MRSEPLQVITEGLSGDGPTDTATSRAILLAVDSGDMPETLELGTPRRVLAFGKHDTSAEGFADAVAAASAMGFQPTVRIAGGRAAVFHEHTVRFGWSIPAVEPAASMHERFERLSAAVVDTLTALSIPGTVGEVPGEYCPGRYSVHVSGRKVMGVGQRLTRHAAYVGGVVVLDGVDDINTVLGPVYGHLGITFDPATTGALSDSRPVTAEGFMGLFAQSIAGSRDVTRAEVPDAVRVSAEAMRADHDLTTLARPR